MNLIELTQGTGWREQELSPLELGQVLNNLSPLTNSYFNFVQEHVGMRCPIGYSGFLQCSFSYVDSCKGKTPQFFPVLRAHNSRIMQVHKY